MSNINPDYALNYARFGADTADTIARITHPATVAPMTPLDRYHQAMARQKAAEHDVHAASDARALAIVDALDAGYSTRQLAAELGITRTRVHQLAERGRTVRGEQVP